MDIETAKFSGTLAATLELVSTRVATIQAALDGGALILDLGVRVRFPDDRQESIYLGDLDGDASAAALKLALQTYQTKLAELQAALAAL